MRAPLRTLAPPGCPLPEAERRPAPLPATMGGGAAHRRRRQDQLALPGAREEGTGAWAPAEKPVLMASVRALKAAGLTSRRWGSGGGELGQRIPSRRLPQTAARRKSPNRGASAVRPYPARLRLGASAIYRLGTRHCDQPRLRRYFPATFRDRARPP